VAESSEHSLEDMQKILQQPLAEVPGLERGQLENGLAYVIFPNKTPAERFEAHLQMHAGDPPPPHPLAPYDAFITANSVSNETEGGGGEGHVLNFTWRPLGNGVMASCIGLTHLWWEGSCRHHLAKIMPGLTGQGGLFHTHTSLDLCHIRLVGRCRHPSPPPPAKSCEATP